jgi:uncharacterized integral membrane protein (TIGR00698 family)
MTTAPVPLPSSASPQAPWRDLSGWGGMAGRITPGLILCLAVSAAAVALAHVEQALFGRAWLESLVLAILLGATVRTVWSMPESFRPGVEFCARPVLEVAILLLGATISAQALASIGGLLFLAVVVIVVVGIGAGYGLGRMLGLPRRMAALVACGNAICGNSAIAAVAPVIKADGEEVASAIAFTAVLGVAVVLILPLLGVALQMGGLEYGVLAGLTVYAVPQVLAAAAPMGTVATQTGALIKLVRVLMLGPVVLAASLIMGRAEATTDGEKRRPKLSKLVPWFIIGFLILLAARSLGLIPTALVEPAGAASSLLTIVAMAGLGLQTDLRVVGRGGGRVALAATLSLLVLVVLAFGLITLLGI